MSAEACLGCETRANSTLSQLAPREAATKAAKAQTLSVECRTGCSHRSPNVSNVQPLRYLRLQLTSNSLIPPSPSRALPPLSMGHVCIFVFGALFFFSGLPCDLFDQRPRFVKYEHDKSSLDVRSADLICCRREFLWWETFPREDAFLSLFPSEAVQQRLPCAAAEADSTKAKHI